MNASLSVIIPAHQEEKHLPGTLESLVSQPCQNFEVIVVANGCTDSTVEIAKAYKTKLNLKVIETEIRGIGTACNIGTKAAHSDLYVFLDADSKLSPNALDVILEKNAEGYIGGTILLKPEENRVLYLLWALGCRITKGADWGPVRVCKADVYHQVGGHREQEDFGLDRDIMLKIKREGRTFYSTKAFHITSMRRFEKLGYREMFRQNFASIFSRITRKPVSGDYPVIR